ncbi:DUF742 domain-containing protein [Streptomyces sp. NPDC096311]|uniref:DUF742 domain-containing protein n=1 Tax=Streptomyces sp. NPDC096311 TaxID=3366083 RepID=UPI0038232581
MAANRGPWAEAALGDVRPYAITGGRTRTKYALHLTTLLSTRPATRPGEFGIEAEQVRLRCSGAALSIAEIAALLHQPAQVIKVLVGDLLDAGALDVAAPRSIAAHNDTDLLEAVLVGLHNKL